MRAFHPVGEVLHPKEVLDILDAAIDRLGELRLVLPQPREQLVEFVDLLERVVAGIRANPDADRSRRERDQPHPVTLAEQVIGAELPDPRFLHVADPAGVVAAPILEIQSAAEPEPGRVDVVPAIGAEAKLALEKRGPAGRVHHPARGRARWAPEMLELDRAWVAELDLPDSRSLRDLHSERTRARGKLVLEQAAVDLVVGVRREVRA